jgi:type VI protein secretion system component VasF
MLSQQKRWNAQATVGILSIFVVAALAVALFWLAIQFTTDLAGTFEVIAEIVGWILLPFRV